MAAAGALYPNTVVPVGGGLFQTPQAAPRVAAPPSPPSPSVANNVYALAPVNTLVPLVDNLEHIITGGPGVQDPLVQMNLRLWRAQQEMMDLFAIAVNNHAATLETHYGYISNASKVVKKLGLGVKDKFSALDTEIGQMRTYLETDKVEKETYLRTLTAEIQTKVAEIEQKFGTLQSGPWVDLITKEVEKHGGAFSLLAVDLHKFDKEMKDVKNAVQEMVYHIEAFEKHPTPPPPPGMGLPGSQEDPWWAMSGQVQDGQAHVSTGHDHQPAGTQGDVRQALSSQVLEGGARVSMTGPGLQPAGISEAPLPWDP